VGKTLVSQALSSKLDALYLNLTDLATRRKLILGEDKTRKTLIINEKKMNEELAKIINECNNKDVIVDGHYAVNAVPKQLVSHVFVLRRDPVELRKLMEQRGFSGAKLWENLASEILDVCLVDALGVHGGGEVCELDVSGKAVEEIVAEILAILESKEGCQVGIVDWIGKLESEGLLDEFLRI
jgi:adenylate kinase